MILYRTIAKEGPLAEQVIEKSRFIGEVKEVHSREEADEFFAEMRAKYKGCTHCVPACIIGEKGTYQWASDNGEPQGTAGPPMLQVLDKEGVTNVAMVVIRYFGGKLLGTGGLVRAYGGTAKMTLEAAGIARVEERLVQRIAFDYTHYGKLQNLEKDGLFTFGEVGFTDLVTAQVISLPEDEGEVAKLFSDVTNGAARVVERAIEAVRVPE
ncbi:MAG: YigZ family protein [Clostridiales bacterium]|nr:YigZ family protein [Clostridiales bacterium]